jgi:hypothetical protein
MLLVLLAVDAAQPPINCERRPVQAAALDRSDPRKLGELPPGLVQLAVDKRVGGCSVAVLPVRDADGNHRMIPQEPLRTVPAHRGSRQQGRPQRQR